MSGSTAEFSPISPRLLQAEIDAGAGDDIIRAGAGNDVVDGGSGNDILVGGDGDDILVGSEGRDMLIGGIGADCLHGNAGDDILIAGFTGYDNDLSALTSIMQEWTNSHNYNTRVANLQAGTGLTGGFRLNGNDGRQLPWNPLTAALMRDESAIVDLLIRHGADPNNVDPIDGITHVIEAAIGNHDKAAQVLLARGAKINHADKRGMTALHYAASIDFGDTAVIERLLAAGANRNAKNKDGDTALDLANRYQHAAIAKVLSR